MTDKAWIVVILMAWTFALLYWVVEFLKARIEESKARTEWYRRKGPQPIKPDPGVDECGRNPNSLHHLVAPHRPE